VQNVSFVGKSITQDEFNIYNMAGLENQEG
jgi:hypothetical protein